MIATVVPPPSSPARSPSNIGTTSSATQPWAMRSWIASFTTLTAYNLPEKACENRPPASKLLTQTQTPEPITMSVEAAAHHRVKYLLTIKRNKRSPSREIAAHNPRNAQSGRSERLQEGEEAVVRLEAGSLAALVRLELRQGSFLEGEVGMQVRLRRLDRFMTEPQRDHGAVDAGLQQFHRSAVAQHVRRHALGLQRRATLVSDTNMLSQQRLDAVGTEPGPVHVGEQRCCSFP